MYDHIDLPLQYRLGHEKIDAQHAQLFACLMHMQKVIKNEDNKNNKKIEESINEIIRFLRSYAQGHFSYEEAIMKRLHDPNLEQHQKLHNEFIQNIIEIQLKGARERLTKIAILNEVSKYVAKWYINHILQEDRKIVEFEKEVQKKNAG